MERLKTTRAAQTRRAKRAAALTSTDERIIAAAIDLLDSGGEAAVTLRAVAQACDVSHNAPYKHFESRDALLAAIARRDFEALRRSSAEIRASSRDPIRRLKGALGGLIEFSHQHPGRYGLLFRNPDIATAAGSVKAAAQALFFEFVELVEACQQAGKLPAAPSATLASLLFATMHGLISIEATAGLHPEKGLSDIKSSVELLLELLAPR
jgi:AcrR family transcriptional regulator